MAPKTTIDFRKPVEAVAAAALSCCMKNCSGGGENVAAVADGFFS